MTGLKMFTNDYDNVIAASLDEAFQVYEKVTGMSRQVLEREGIGADAWYQVDDAHDQTVIFF